jgi:two-component system copper resistance phosphate regulon response regulator CusR
MIVEDEVKTGDYLRQGLTEAGFVVDLARDGYRRPAPGAHTRRPRPGRARRDAARLDGWQVLQTLRRSGREMPVLFLTARDQVEDRSRGWNWAPTTTWSSPSPSPNCSPRAHAAAPRAQPRKPTTLRAPTWSSTCCAAG